MTKKILSVLFLILTLLGVSLFYFTPKNEVIHFTSEDIIYHNANVELAVTPCPLLTNSLSITSTTPKESFTAWTSPQHAEVYHLLQNIATLWRENDSIEDFLIIGRVPSRMHADRFFWEIVPYPQSSWKILNQFTMMWHLLFNSPCLSKQDQLTIK